MDDQSKPIESRSHNIELNAKISPSDTVNAIFVLGPSSSGKTTLCDAIAADLHLNSARYVKEVARDVMKTQGFSRAHTDTYDMQAAIMIAQLKAETNVLQNTSVDVHANTEDSGDLLLLSDRSAVDPIVYAATSGTETAKSNRARLISDPGFQAALPLYRRSLFIVLQPVEEWLIDDGVRSLEDPWRYNEELCRTLRELEISFVEIGEDTKELKKRVEMVKRYSESQKSRVE